MTIDSSGDNPKKFETKSVPFDNVSISSNITHPSTQPPVPLSFFGFPDSTEIPELPQQDKVVSLDFSNTLADMNSWAEQRVSIFASLDAALSRAVVEAATALNELKQQTENEARITTMAIITERERLQRQVEELRLERVRLQDQLSEVKREIEAEETRRLALARESQVTLDNMKLDRDRVQVEVNQLSHQMENMGQQLQNFFKQRFAELWEQFSNSVTPNPPETVAKAPTVEQVFGNEFNPLSAWSETSSKSEQPGVIANLDQGTSSQAEEESLQVDNGEIKKAVTLQQFEDAVTPKVNIVPIVLNQAMPPSEPLPVVTSAPVTNDSLSTLEKLVFNSSEIELDESDFSKIFETSQPLANSTAAADSSPSAMPKVFKASSRKRRQTVTRQHIENMLNRRSNRPAQISSEHTKTDSRRRRALRDREAFEELGAKLGLEADVTTPPPFDQMFFAEGFTPPPDVSNFLLRMSANQEIGSSPSAAKSKLDKNRLSDVGTISLEEIFTQIPNDLPEEDALGQIWDEPAPTIGELGPDFAQHWHGNNFQKTPEAVNEASLEKVEAQKEVETVTPLKIVQPEPQSIKSTSSDNPFDSFSDFPIKPPPLKVATEIEQKASVTSKVYVLNLQGLALLTIEKVVRSLPGVYQVVVTTLEKGEIGMEVIHHPELALDKVLPNLPDFRLKLVERDQNVLKFNQMR